MEERQIDIEALVQDDLNFNKGCAEGEKMIDYSLEHFGCGRSVVLDKNNRIIAGNKTAASAIKAGIKKVRVVEVTGDKLVAVKRTDVDLDTKQGREFALADNITANVNFNIDMEKVKEAMERVEMHPEIWNVEVPQSNTDGPDRFGGDKNTTVQVESFKFGVYDIVLSKAESEELQRRAKAYGKEHGKMDGFINTLLDEYYERRDQ
jgi:hypothetical protein